MVLSLLLEKEHRGVITGLQEWMGDALQFLYAVLFHLISRMSLVTVISAEYVVLWSIEFFLFVL